MKKHLSSAPSIRVRRRRGHAPSERKTAIAAILVICAVIIAVSAALCCKAGFPACSAQRTPPPQNTFVPTSASLTTATPELTSTPLPTATPAPYTFVSVSVSDAAEGQLALVNFEHGFPAADSTDVVPVTAAGSLLTERNDLSLAQPALSALSALAEAFSERTGGDRLLLTSAYRTLEYQQGVYDDYVAAYGQAAADAYVAAPGTSEHHTGLAADLSSMSKDGERVTLPNHPQFEWLKAHCADYGFILRYPAHLFITLPLIMDFYQCLGKPFRCSLGYRYAAGNLFSLSLCHTFPPPLNHMTACLYPFPALCIISSVVKLFLYAIFLTHIC